MIGSTEVGHFMPEYTVAPDGRFLMSKNEPQSEIAPQLIVVRNWSEELTTLVPFN